MRVSFWSRGFWHWIAGPYLSVRFEKLRGWNSIERGAAHFFFFVRLLVPPAESILHIKNPNGCAEARDFPCHRIEARFFPQELGYGRCLFFGVGKFRMFARPVIKCVFVDANSVGKRLEGKSVRHVSLERLAE